MAEFDHAVGRYVHLEVESIQHRVYFEESGAPNGVPLLLQHTAGSDARQWRHFLENDAVREHYRMIAYDLPYHGKSVPPDGWWEREYKLTKSFLMSFVTTLASALDLENSGLHGQLDRRPSRTRPGAAPPRELPRPSSDSRPRRSPRAET